MIHSARRSGRRRFVICGDNPLAYRLAVELVDRADADVTVILPSRKRKYGPKIASLPGVRIVEAEALTPRSGRAAGVPTADALALMNQDDVGNIHAALCAQELSPTLRLVIRFENLSLGYRIRELFPGSVVLSDTATAAPAFVAAALGTVTPGAARLPGRPRRAVVVANRKDVPARRVVCGLANTTAPDGPVRLPMDESTADLVLALAENPNDPSAASLAKRVLRRVGRLVRWQLRALFTRKLVLTSLALLSLLVLGTYLFSAVRGGSWHDAIYLTVLDVAGAAEPDTELPGAEKVIQALVTVVGIALIPLLTAAVVDAIVSAKLEAALGQPRRLKNHVVVAGLGNVGARALQHLHELGVPVIGVDHDERARGVSRSHRLGIPLVIGDCSREDVLREAHLGSARALVAVTNNDVANLEAALHGRAMRPNLRVGIRLFDDDFALRVERTFGIEVSRSVSFLAAPAFAAAMLQREVLTTIPIGRQVLLIAEIPVPADCALIDTRVETLNVPERVRVLALLRQGQQRLDLPAPPDHVLSVGDRLVVVATRTGLADLAARSTQMSTGERPTPSTTSGAVASTHYHFNIETPTVPDPFKPSTGQQPARQHSSQRAQQRPDEDDPGES